MSLATPWSSTDFGNEFGLGGAYTSAQAAAAAKLGTSFTSADLAAANAYTPPSATTDVGGISKIFNEGLNNGAKTLTTSGAVTAIVSNGVGPYSYSWFIANGDSSITIDSPTSASTSCSATLATNSSTSCNIECQVTDSHGTKCWTGQVSVYLELDNTF